MHCARRPFVVSCGSESAQVCCNYQHLNGSARAIFHRFVSVIKSLR